MTDSDTTATLGILNAILVSDAVQRTSNDMTCHDHATRMRTVSDHKRMPAADATIAAFRVASHGDRMRCIAKGWGCGTPQGSALGTRRAGIQLALYFPSL